MPKFFVNPGNINGNNIYIRGEDVNHITKVLRLSQNDIIIVCDGLGKDYKVGICEINKKEIKTEIINETFSESEPSIYIVLFQGIPKAGKMEYIIQKNTELGIGEIVPVMTKRTVVKLDDKRTESNKMERWQKVSYEAAKQSNRGRVPIVSKPVSFSEAVNRMALMDLNILPYEKEHSCSLRSELNSRVGIKTAGIFIGPEGGFDDEEISLAKEAGLNTVTLGPRILRTETAGAAVLAILMYEFGGI